MAGIVLAEGVVEVTADATGVPGQIAKDVDSNQSQIAAAGDRAGKGFFGKLVAAGATFAIGKGLINFFGDAIGGASDLMETTSKATTIFGGVFGAIDQWSEQSAQKLGLSKEAALDAASGFGNMFSQLGFAQGDAAKMSTTVVQAAADLGSFNNLPTADVADRMSAAFRGEYDSLQALIPNINAARVEAEAMAATGKTNAEELTAQEKAAAVLAIVQKDGAAAMGDFAKTAEGAANTQKTLTATLEDQQGKLGAALLPMWQGFLGFLTDEAIPVLTQVVSWISQNASWLTPLAIGLGVATAAFWLLNIAMMANPIALLVGAIILGIGLIVGAVIWLASNWDTVMKFMGSVGLWLWNSIIQPVTKGIANAFLWVQGVVLGVVNWLTAAFTNIGNVVRDIFGGIGSFISGVFNNIVNFIKGPINTVIGFINKAIDGVNVIGGAFGVNIGHIPKLARGSAFAPNMYIAGEAGPELIMGAGGSRVYPADQTRRMLDGGEGNTEINIEINEATDPLGSAGRVSTELRKWRKR